jgi:hypothetical protein
MIRPGGQPLAGQMTPQGNFRSQQYESLTGYLP